MRERIVLLVDMDAFFASCEQATDPRLMGKPVIVCGAGDGDSPAARRGGSASRTVPKGVVAACSYEAKARGVDNGMSIPQALALCPAAVLVGGDPEKYTDIARRIFEGLTRYTPLTEIVSIDEAFLDVTDTWPRFQDSPEALAAQIQGEVEEAFHLSCTAGIGPNKLLAKLAAKLNKPHGIGRIRPEDLPGCLSPLPVEKLNGIGPNLARALLAMGVVTLGELAQLPVSRLTSRFGFYGELLFRMARGIDESPVLPSDFPETIKSMGHSHTLDRDTRDPAIVQGTLLKLSEKVGRRLRAAGYGGKTVSVVLRFSDFSAVSRQRTVGDYVSDDLRIYRAACHLLTQLWQPPGRPVRLVGVGVANLLKVEVPGFNLAPSHSDLWEDERRRQRLIRSLDRINDRLGEETITWAGALVPFVEKTRGTFGRRWIEQHKNRAL